MIRHVVWDWNATLFGDGPALIAATIEAFEVAGLPAIDAVRYRAAHGPPLRAFYRALLGRDPTREEWSALTRAFGASYARQLPELGLAPDGLAALVQVAASGRSQSLLSMFPQAVLAPLVERFDLARWFARWEGFVGGAAAGEPGHKAEHLGRHLDRLAVPGPEALVVGDSVDDARAARTVGATCVLYEGGLHDRPDLEAVGVPVADSLLGALAAAGVHP